MAGAPQARRVYVRVRLQEEAPADADVAGPARAAAMERDGEQLSARPALETEGLHFLHITGESPRFSGPRACPAGSSARRRVRWVGLRYALGRA